jgi:hypothetical protein
MQNFIGAIEFKRKTILASFVFAMAARKVELIASRKDYFFFTIFGGPDLGTF